MEPTNHLLQIISSKWGLGTKPMWSGCVRAAPDVVVAAGSRELEYFEYDLDDDDDEEAEEAEYEEEVATAACAACSIGSDLPPPAAPNPATPSANANTPLPSAFFPAPLPPPPFKLKASFSSSSSRRHDGPRLADDALKTVSAAGGGKVEREVKRGSFCVRSYTREKKTT